MRTRNMRQEKYATQSTRQKELLFNRQVAQLSQRDDASCPSVVSSNSTKRQAESLILLVT